MNEREHKYVLKRKPAGPTSPLLVTAFYYAKQFIENNHANKLSFSPVLVPSTHFSLVQRYRADYTALYGLRSDNIFSFSIFLTNSINSEDVFDFSL